MYEDSRESTWRTLWLGCSLKYVCVAIDDKMNILYFLEYMPGRLFLSRHRGPGVKTRPAFKRGRHLFPSHRSRYALFQLLFHLLLWQAKDLQIVDL